LVFDFEAVAGFFIFGRGGLFATTSTARSKRRHASVLISISSFFFEDFAMAKSPHGRSVEKLATEIGYVCIHWAWLEDVIDYLIAQLAKIDVEGWNNPAKAWHAITGNLDIRQKAQILKALFFLRKGNHEDWYKHSLETINVIDNDLRSRRNHLIHSSLRADKGKFFREKKVVKITKPQAFQKEELRTLEARPATITEARKLQKDILKYITECGIIYGFALMPEIAEQRGISFRQFLRQAKSSDSRKRKRARPKRQRQ
jgi:hypothetical protein